MTTKQTLEDELEQFRLNYHSKNVIVGNYDMQYRVGTGYAKKASVRANKIIRELNLNLVAIPFGKRGNYFIVKSDQTPDL